MQEHLEILNELRNLNIVAKTLSMKPNPGSEGADRVLFLLMQIENPSWYRPTKNRKRVASRELEILIQNRHVTIRPKPAMFFTKKTALTLLPEQGKIDLYMPRMGEPVGLLFRLSACHLKGERYIFPAIAETDKEDNRYLAEKISLSDLKARLSEYAKHGTVAPCNELDLGLSMEALAGIFAAINDKKSLGYAIRIQTLIQDKFQLKLPIFIQTAERGLIPWHHPCKIDSLNSASPVSVLYPDLWNLIIQSFSLMDLGHLMCATKGLFSLFEKHPFFLTEARRRALPVPFTWQSERSVDCFVLAWYLKPFNGLVNANNFHEVKALAIKKPGLAKGLLTFDFYQTCIPEDEKKLTKEKNTFAGAIASLLFSIIFLPLFYWVYPVISSLILCFTLLSLASGFFIFFPTETALMRLVLNLTLSPLVFLVSALIVTTTHAFQNGFNAHAAMQTFSLLGSAIFWGSTEDSINGSDPWAFFTRIRKSEKTISETLKANREPGYLTQQIYAFYHYSLADSLVDKKLTGNFLLRFLEWFYLSIPCKQNVDELSKMGLCL